MARILGIDYGKRRCGIAATDPLRIVATPVATVETKRLDAWLDEYLAHEEVDTLVVGLPRDMRGRDSESMSYIRPAVGKLRQRLSPRGIRVVMYDERFTSVLAHRAMLDGGLNRSDRRDKATVDRVAAALILNDYLQSRQYQSDQENR